MIDTFAILLSTFYTAVVIFKTAVLSMNNGRRIHRSKPNRNNKVRQA